MNPVEGTTAQLQAIHPEIPPDRLATKVLRTFIGSFFVLTAAILLLVLIVLPAVTAFRANVQPTFSLMTLAFGVALPVALCLVGANVWSTQLVARPVALTVAAFKGIWTAVRGGAPPAPGGS